jgi:RNA polymerase sigma factor (TIGR02999 family)
VNDITRILNGIECGKHTAEELLPLVYDELRRLAAAKLAREAAGQTLQPTSLVHEAYLRVVGSNPAQNWDTRTHFFAAAAEAMRRILIENARRKRREKHGGTMRRVELDEADLPTTPTPDELLALDETLDKLAKADPAAAQLVKLRYFAGVSVEDAAEMAGYSRATAYRHWTFARAWLRQELRESGKS